MDVLELDAASNNGVDQVRALRDEAAYTPTAVRKRIYIVDEVHMLSTAAFNALLKILEEPPEHLMFILATTELHKVPPTILSRCQRFSFKRIQPEDIIGRIQFVAAQEQLQLTQDGAALLARLADGGMRDALSLLDQCAAEPGVIDRNRVLDTLGLAGNLKTAHILNAIRRGDSSGALSQFGALYSAGKDVSAVLSELISLCRDLLVRQTAPNAGLLCGGYDEATLNTLTKNMPPERLIAMLERLEQAQEDCKRSGSSRTVAEICLIRLCDPSLDGSTAGLAARIARLEGMLAQGIVPTQSVDQPTQGAQTALPQSPTTVVNENNVRMSLREPAPEQAAQSPQQPKANVTNSWKSLVAALNGRIGMPAYAFIKKLDPSGAVWGGNRLTVYFKEEFEFIQVNKPEVVREIASAASAQAGCAVSVELKRGAPEVSTAQQQSPQQGVGSVHDLARFMRQFQNQ